MALITEAYLVFIAVICALVGLLSFIAVWIARVYAPDSDSDLLVILQIGIVFLPLSIVVLAVGAIMALVNGNFSLLWNALLHSGHANFMSMVASGKDFSQGCTDPETAHLCPKYCCKSNSVPGVAVKDEKEDCAYRYDMDTVCIFRKVQTSKQQDSSVCNINPNLGAITCQCCIGRSTQKLWWDCNKDCCGNTTEKGMNLQSPDRCVQEEVDFLLCNSATNEDTSVNKDTTNSQLF